jgi:hypothetical protein
VGHSKEKASVRLLPQRLCNLVWLFLITQSLDRVKLLDLRALLGLALGLRGRELVGLGEKLRERGDEVGLLGDRSVLVGDVERAGDIVRPLASQSEHNRADLGADALDLLEDRLLSLAIGRDAVDEGGEVIGRIALVEIGLRRILADVVEVLSDQVRQSVRDALGLGHGAIFVLDLGDVLGRDLSESFAALDVVLQIAHGQDWLLEGDSALGRLRGLADMPLRGGEDRITFAVGLEDSAGEGCDEFEVLSAHVLCFSELLVVCFGMFMVARP